MKKITIEVFVPASDKSYEMRIPRNMKVGKANELIMEYLKGKADESYIPGPVSRLCSSKNGEPYDWNLFIEELGLENGDRILVI